ncbi:MAG: hypothetical protein ABEJ93_04610 [Candidatus Nanohalobium sp.]
MAEENNSEKSGRKLQYDLRRRRKNQIAYRVNQLDESLSKVYRERSLEAARNWFADLRVLWQQIKHYIEDEEEVKEVESLIDKFHEKLESEDPLQVITRSDFKNLHDKVNYLRIEEAGLDIPVKEETEEKVEDFYL